MAISKELTPFPIPSATLTAAITLSAINNAVTADEEGNATVSRTAKTF